LIEGRNIDARYIKMWQLAIILAYMHLSSIYHIYKLSQEQELEWGRTLAAAMGTWPRLQRLAVTVSIIADPRDIILISDENTTQTAPLAAFFTLIENAINHQINQADADNLDLQRSDLGLPV
jgi:hypothetical protein